MRIGQYEITLRRPIHVYRYPTEEEIKIEMSEISERHIARTKKIIDEYYAKYGCYPDY